jgi:hypothetical protein
MAWHLLGASVAKWLAHLPFTSEAAGSNLTKYFLNATRTQSSCEKSKSQLSAESRGFSPVSPVSSHRESWQGGLGKEKKKRKKKGPTVIGICCCGDPALVGKAI